MDGHPPERVAIAEGGIKAGGQKFLPRLHGKFQPCLGRRGSERSSKSLNCLKAVGGEDGNVNSTGTRWRRQLYLSKPFPSIPRSRIDPISGIRRGGACPSLVEHRCWHENRCVARPIA